METTQALLNELVKSLGDSYAEQLAAMPMKKQTREILVDGFRAGLAHGARHACGMLGVKIRPLTCTESHVYAPLDDTCIHCGEALPRRERS